MAESPEILATRVRALRALACFVNQNAVKKRIENERESSCNH